ncbi:MAG: hypothetical protein JOZ74_15130 [Bradyrhizobium sp.]|nr:hypothetical protein [Bradyrhizobium sp.]
MMLANEIRILYREGFQEKTILCCGATILANPLPSGNREQAPSNQAARAASADFTEI